jgi:hypothetical protein
LGARFRSEGPAWQNLELAACVTANTNPDGDCREDESGGPLGPTSSVTCTGVILGGKGELIQVDFLYQGDETAVSVQEEGPGSVTVFSADLFANEGNLPEGDYTCRFSVAGEPVADKPFSIAG